MTGVAPAGRESPGVTVPLQGGNATGEMESQGVALGYDVPPLQGGRKQRNVVRLPVGYRPGVRCRAFVVQCLW